MRTITTTVYNFEELSNSGKEKAIENFYYLNVDYEWWDSTYEDAATIGLKITEFDLGRAQYCRGDFTEYAIDVAKLILKNHGDMCETYFTAEDYLVEYKLLVTEQCQEDADVLCLPGNSSEYEDYVYYSDIDTEDIDHDFLQLLLEDYKIMLSREYEYLTSKEAIVECIKGNEYEFTSEGTPV